MKILVIPDVHLKPGMFERAAELMRSGAAERCVCLMDIPDDWNMEFVIGAYSETFDAAISFQREFPETLWSYGNHDLSYIWQMPETGYSPMAIQTVNEKLSELRQCLPDPLQMQYIHRIDDVIFLHGGLTHAFVKYYAADADYDDTDAVLRIINGLGVRAMWDDASPIWYRPQVEDERLYRQDELLQVVGHTPVRAPERRGSVVSCDLFSTYRTGDPIGTQEYLLIDTLTWEFSGIA